VISGDSHNQGDAASHRRRLAWVGLLVLLALAIGVFAVRGVWRGHVNSIDLKMIYASSVAWAEGGEAYSSQYILQRFRDRGGDPEREHVPEWFFSLYPPATYVLMSPLGVMSWPWAKWVWIGVNMVATGVVIVAGAWLMGWPARVFDSRRNGWVMDPRMLVWTVMVLLFMPVHLVISQGQLSLVCVALMFIGLVLLQRGEMEDGRWGMGAGVLLGLSAALKPQVGGMLVLLLPIMGQWRGFMAACVTGVGVLGVGVVRLELAGVSWLPEMLENMRRFSPAGEFGAGQAAQAWHLLLGFETLLQRFTANVTLTAGISLGVSVAFLVLIVIGHRRGSGAAAGLSSAGPRPAAKRGEEGSARDEGGWWLLSAGALAALTLLPTYNRPYDAVVLLVPGLVVCDALFRRDGWHGPLVLAGLGLAIFYLPNSAVLASRLGMMLGEGVRSSLLFQGTVMVNQVWALLAVLVGMTWWLWRRARSPVLPSLDRVRGPG
jgi:hypothetical protein